jgi:hypothetical protein
MKVTSVFIKYLNYVSKIKPANENILLCRDSFEKPYKQLELVSHRDIQKLENNV